MNRRRLFLLLGVAALAALAFALGLQRHLSLEAFQAQRALAVDFYRAEPWLAALAFAALYVVATGLSLPGSAVLTLAAGAVFGLAAGVVLVSFASTLGATLAFLLSRYLFRDAVQRRFERQLEPINRGVREDGAYYLFALRLVPVFPFFAVNLAMGLTPIGWWTFAWVSQLGMLAATAVFVNAGREIGRLESMDGILSPGMLLSLALLGVFPLLARKATARLSRRFRQGG